MERIPTEWLPHYTYQDYVQWKGDWELIQGFPYAMSPSPKRIHQQVARKLIRLLEEKMMEQPDSCDCEVFFELDWIVSEHTVVRPDIMIVCGPFTDDYLRFPPALVVEVALSHTRMADRNVKFKIYEENGVGYYILVDPEQKAAEVFRLTDNTFQNTNEHWFVLNSRCNFILDVNDIWKQ